MKRVIFLMLAFGSVGLGLCLLGWLFGWANIARLIGFIAGVVMVVLGAGALLEHFGQ